MKAPLFRSILAGLLLAFAAVPPSQAQDYPTGPVKIVVTVSPGSTIDVIARLLAEQLTRMWGQQVIIANAPGGGGGIAARTTITSPPDGYTLFVATSSVYTLLHQTQPNLPFDINRDLVTIGFIGEQPMGFAVAPALGVKTMAEFIAAAKKRPGEINYAASNRGTIPHLSVELLRAHTGVDIAFVPYTGSAKALTDLIGGRISMIVDGLAGLTGAIDGGQLKLLATGAPKRLPNFPDVPTVAETVPSYVAIGWFLLAAPAKTPEHVLRKVRQDMYAALAQPELKRKFEELGTYPNLMTPPELDAFLVRERALWSGALQQIGEIKQ